MNDLKDENCQSCDSNTKKLAGEEKVGLLSRLANWEIVSDHHLQKQYSFKNYAEALNWVNTISAVAEEQNHHPEVTFTWGKVTIKIWTHSIDSLSRGDFVLAAKIDALDHT